MLNLPVPEAEYENVVLKPSEYQKDMVASLAERAEAVRDRQVQPYEDNMLKITNDGRKLALDQRLINDMLPDDENSKASTCVEKAFEIWEQTNGQKSTQLIFCDLSTPKGDGTFNVYEDIRNKLIEKGVPPEEIAFIHEANTELRKAELFGKVRSGQVRFLLGLRWSSIFVTFTLKKIIDWNISFQTVSCIHLMNVDVYDCNSHIHNPACFHLTLDLFQTDSVA